MFIYFSLSVLSLLTLVLAALSLAESDSPGISSKVARSSVKLEEEESLDESANDFSPTVTEDRQ